MEQNSQLNKKTDIPWQITALRSVIRRFSYLLVIFTEFFLQPVQGSNNYPAGARSMALSHASVSFSDTWAAFHNQAGLAGIKTISAGFYYESKFGIEELELAAGSVVLPLQSGVFGFSLYQFGTGTFRENKFGLAFSKRLSPKWSTGIQIDYYSQLLPENNAASGFPTIEGGVLFKASEKFHLAAHAFNPVSGGFEYPSGKMELPFTIKAGGHYSFDETVLVAFGAEKDKLKPLVVKWGIEYLPAENLAIRIGASGKPFNYTAGFGYKTGKLSADIGFGYHGSLGITPSLSVQFIF